MVQVVRLGEAGGEVPAHVPVLLGAVLALHRGGRGLAGGEEARGQI